MTETLKIPEVARRLGISEKTVRRHVKSGELSSLFVGGAYRVSEEDLEEFVESRRSKPPKAGEPLASEYQRLDSVADAFESYSWMRFEEHAKELHDPDSQEFRDVLSGTLWIERVARENEQHIEWFQDQTQSLENEPMNVRNTEQVMKMAGVPLASAIHLIRGARGRIAQMEDASELDPKRLERAKNAAAKAERGLQKAAARNVS